MDLESKIPDKPYSAEDSHNGLPSEGELVPLVLKGVIDPVYEGKAQVLNTAIQDIGMGWYQWQLFIVVGGFGWASDNLWPIVTSLILLPVANEFKQTKPPLLSLAQNIGLLVGAIFWGFGCMDTGSACFDGADITQVTYLVASGLLISPSASPPYSGSSQLDRRILQRLGSSLLSGALASGETCRLTRQSSSNSSQDLTNIYSQSCPSSGPLLN